MTQHKVLGANSSPLPDGRYEHGVRRRSPSSAAVAHLGMPQVRVRVLTEVAKELHKVAAERWPGQGKRAVDRVAREAIRTYLRQIDGKK